MEEQRNRELEHRAKERRMRRKLRQKNRIILLETVLIIALAVALIIVSVGYVGLKNDPTVTDNSSAESTASSDNSSISSTNSSVSSENSQVSSITSSEASSSQQPINKDELDQWYLKLVNPDNKVDNQYLNSIERSKIKNKYIVSTTKDTCKYLDSRIVSYFENMCKAAADDGVTLVSVSAYRSISYQTGLYDRRVERCQNEDGLSLEDAKKKAATIVAVPGTSEHHLGLAIDINSVETSFENTRAFRWLQENAEKYGFIMRYPKDKQSITKIIYEPWHYRYVGVEHAKAMNDLGMCLEEYVEHLSKK